MSRFDAPLPETEYSPCLVLSAREHDEGGGVRTQVAVSGRASGLPCTELLVLVHGFNNHVREAQEDYRWFRYGQEAMLGRGDRDRLEERLGDFFWPGDAKWPGLLDYVDFLVYPAAVGNSMATAQRLADYLRQRTDAFVLHFVGHSLGCRVILETIRLLRARGGGPTIGKVCLMAAAVPTSKVVNGGDLFDAITAPSHLRVLYSPDDMVLEFVFGPGQTISGQGEGFFPTAVGRYGDIPLSPGHL
ncbi:MAG: alpha/beta hydrolase [Leptothrix sp. (in: b-proteobacteria)]